MKITARTLSGEICQVEIEGHFFKKITPLKKDILDLPWIAPGLIDIQINGFAGVDFNRVLESDDAWHHATKQLYAHGCTGFLIALITNTERGYRGLLADLTRTDQSRSAQLPRFSHGRPVAQSRSRLSRRASGRVDAKTEPCACLTNGWKHRRARCSSSSLSRRRSIPEASHGRDPRGGGKEK